MILISKENLLDEFGVADVVYVCSTSPVADKKSFMKYGYAQRVVERYPKSITTMQTLIYKQKNKQLFFTADTRDVSRHEFCKIGMESHLGLLQIARQNIAGADLTLINQAVRRICFWADKFQRIAVEFPGCAYPGIHIDSTMAIMAQLPDNCFVYDTLID